MSERADLRMPCEHGRYDGHEAIRNVGTNSTTTMGAGYHCPGGRTLTPAGVLAILLPDVDWEALRAALAWHPRGLGDLVSTEAEYRVLEEIEGAARRLLAVYDGKDG